MSHSVIARTHLSIWLTLLVDVVDLDVDVVVTGVDVDAGDPAVEVAKTRRRNGAWKRSHWVFDILNSL